jgi:hypothetical protein
MSFKINRCLREMNLSLEGATEEFLQEQGKEKHYFFN